MADAQVETSYEANTVAELQEELRSRGLHTSGNKEELIARLEEDDAAAGEQENVPDQGLPEPEVNYYPPITYHPLQLPANTAAAQAFIDAHPESVDETIPMDPDVMAAAQNNVAVHIDAMAEIGVTVEDPRVPGYVPPVEEVPPEVPPEAPPAELEEAKS